MSFTVEVSGFRELERALTELPKSIAKGVLVRTLKKAAEPIAENARAAVPIGTGRLRDSIAVSTRIKNKVGSAEFAQAMAAGLGKAAATSALRDARRAAKAQASFAEVFVGPKRGKGVVRYAHLVEFGTVKTAPHAFMRPAWDAQKARALAIIREELGNQIMAAARRLGRSKKYSVEIKYRASIAALLAHEAGS